MNGLSSHEWRSDYHPADRINALEERIKELEDALEKVLCEFDFSTDNSYEVFRLGTTALATKEKP
jgi:hypothetical protein